MDAGGRVPTVGAFRRRRSSYREGWGDDGMDAGGRATQGAVAEGDKFKFSKTFFTVNIVSKYKVSFIRKCNKKPNT
jgi:hypothetical protein